MLEITIIYRESEEKFDLRHFYSLSKHSKNKAILNT